MKLVSGDSYYGLAGEKVNFKDSNGDTLYVGDVIRLFSSNGERGLRSIVKRNSKFFVMGIKGDCPDYDKEGWKIYKEKSYKSMKDGEKIGDITYKEIIGREMTISEIEKELGYSIKIIKEK